MSTLEHVFRSAQPGLLDYPRRGTFVTCRLADGSPPEAVRRALGELVSIADGPGGVRRIVAAVSGRWWQWISGTAPAGGPPEHSILDRSKHFADTGGDVWLFLKAESDAGIEALLEAVDRALGEWIEERDEVHGYQRRDRKILDQHFYDGITSPSDPASVVSQVLQSGEGRADGSCWVFVQTFHIGWDAFDVRSLAGQQDVIGRDDKGVLIPIDDVKRHVERARIFDDNRDNLKLLRQSMPFGESPLGGGREEGIEFVAFTPDTERIERILRRMVGGPSRNSDHLLGIVQGEAGGYFYVPSARELGVDRGLTWADFRTDEHWRVRSANGLMFYNSADYLTVMGTGRYAPGDPPSQRILGLIAKIFSRWRDKWYHVFDIPRIPHLREFLDDGEKHFLEASVPVRRGLAIHKSLTRVHTDRQYPRRPDSWLFRADQFRIDPQDVLVGVMPELSLGRGKEVMPYLNDEERLSGFLEELDETSSMGHVVPDHQMVLERGIDQILDDLRRRRDGAPPGDTKDFYVSAILALEGVQGYCENYAWLAERMAEDYGHHPWEQENLLRLAERMRKAAHEPAGSFVEAVQIIFNMHCCLHLVGNPVSIGRLDQLLAPYFDASSDEAEAQEVLDALWVKLGEKALHNRHHATDHTDYGTTAVAYIGGNFPQGGGINQWVQQVTVGGCLPTDGKKPISAANRITLLCLRSARRLPLNAPVLSLRLYPGIGDEIVREAARALASGGSHPILFHDERMVRALTEYAHLPLEAARDYSCDGCYEPMVTGQSEFAFGNIAPLDALELALNQGARYNQAGPVYLRGWKISWRSPAAEEIESFEQLQAIYLRHLRYLTVQFFVGVLGNYGNVWKYCPSPLLSTMIRGCVERGRDLSNGGARYHLIAPMFVGLATTIDALYAIRKLVFTPETAVTTLPELVEALRNDWGFDMIEPFESTLDGKVRLDAKAERFRQLREQALSLPRFGTGHAEVDDIADWLVGEMATMAREIVEKPAPQLAPILAGIREKHSAPGDPWKLHMQVGIGTFEGYVGDGLTSGASADGRRNAQPYPSDLSPSPVPQDLPPIPQDPAVAPARPPGTYRPIFTSMASWNRDSINLQVSNASPVDLNVRESFPVAELEHLIRKYIDGEVGSNLFTVTVADPETYAMAEKEPERYELVRVRMGGWTEYFAAMFPAHQGQHRRRPYFVPEPGATFST